MSVVVCKILKNGYQIAADSITTRGFTQTKETHTKRSKLFQINGMVIGCVGLAEECSLLHIFCKTHRPFDATEESVLEFLSEFSNWKGKKTDNSKISFSFLLGIENKVFAIEEWLVENITTYEAIGAGMDFALAALYLGHSASEAIQIAIELSILCEGPVQVIDQTYKFPEEKTYKEVEEIK